MKRFRLVVPMCMLMGCLATLGTPPIAEAAGKKKPGTTKKGSGTRVSKPASPDPATQATPDLTEPLSSNQTISPTGDRVIFNEGFERLSPRKWWITRGSWGDAFGEGKRYDASGVTCRDNVATLHADRPNEVGVLYTAPIPVSKGAKLVIRRQMFAHAASRTFGGDFEAFGVADPTPSAAKPPFAQHLFALTYNDFKEGTDLNCFSLQCGTNVPDGPGTHQGGQAPKTDPIWDRWFDEEIVYDSATGETLYSIEGKDVMRAAGKPLEAPYIKFLIHPYGWGTGHYLKMRGFEVIQVGDRPQMAANTGCTGLPPLSYEPTKPDTPAKPASPGNEPPTQPEGERHLPGKPVPPESSGSTKTGPEADRARELHQLGVALYPTSRGNPEARKKALQNLAEAVKLDPTVDAYRIDFADALLHDDNDLGKELGIEIYEEMLAANPADDAALGRLVFGLVETGNVEGALDRLATRAMDSRPLPFALASSLTSIAVTHGKSARVAAILRQAGRRAPDDAMIAVFRAIIERELGNAQAAEALLTAAAKGPAGSFPAAWARSMLQEVRK